MSISKYKIVALIVIILGIIVIVLSCYYKPFVFVRVKHIQYEVNMKIQDVQYCIYKSGDEYLLSPTSNDDNLTFLIGKKRKKITELMYSNRSIRVLNVAILWRKDLLVGADLDFVPKAGQQEVIWNEDQLIFTYGENKEMKYIVEW